MADQEVAKGPTLTHSQAVNRLREITSELERIGELDGPLSAEDDAYFGELTSEFTNVDEHRKKLERTADLERIRAAGKGINASGLRVERGTASSSDDYDRDRVLNPDSVQDRRFRDPWDLSEMRAGLTPLQQAGEVRARALAAIEKMPATDDARRQTMTRFIERFDARDARMSWLALATSSDAYVRAFGKLLGNQGDKSLLDEDEQEALVRAMSLTDSAGG